MATKYKLSPSASERFLICSASIKHQNPFSESIYSLKGNLQHEVAFLRLEQMYKDVDNTKKINALMDTSKWYYNKDKSIKVKWDNGCDKTVEEYISYIKKLHNHFKPKILFLEYNFNFMFYDYKMYGTADVAMVLENNDIVIVDLKTGRNKVETEDNSQMLLYGIGFIQEVSKKLKEVPKRLIISICQPPAYNIKAMVYSIEQVMAWYKKQSKQMWKINNDILEYVPNEKACKYCDYRDQCSARFKKGVY